MSARVLNREKLQKKLERLPAAAKTAIMEAMAKSADDIVRIAKSLVPVDKGDLQKSIGWVWGSKAPRGSISLGTVRQGSLVLTIFAGNDEAYYARYIEFGTQKMAAQPFFYVSYRARRKSAKSRISRAISKAAKKVAASG